MKIPSVSSAAWLVPTVHMLIGIGAVGLAQIMYTRYVRLKRAADAAVLPKKIEPPVAKS